VLWHHVTVLSVLRTLEVFLVIVRYINVHLIIIIITSSILYIRWHYTLRRNESDVLFIAITLMNSSVVALNNRYR